MSSLIRRVHDGKLKVYVRYMYAGSKTPGGSRKPGHTQDRHTSLTNQPQNQPHQQPTDSRARPHATPPGTHASPARHNPDSDREHPVCPLGENDLTCDN